jgi:hypothetical protein
MRRVGPEFDFEREMTIPAMKWLTGQGLLVKREYRTPWGICDLVGLELDHSRVAARRLRGPSIAIGPVPRIAVLKLVPSIETGASIGMDELSTVLCRPVDDVSSDVNVLLKHRFLVQNASARLQSRCDWAPLHRRIVTVELKVDRIREVIQQARAHRLFATESYIGLPAKSAGRYLGDGRGDELKSAGVGLLSVCAAAATVLVSAPVLPSNAADGVLQMHCVERFWRDFTSKLT